MLDTEADALLEGVVDAEMELLCDADDVAEPLVLDETDADIEPVCDTEAVSEKLLEAVLVAVDDVDTDALSDCDAL